MSSFVLKGKRVVGTFRIRILWRVTFYKKYIYILYNSKKRIIGNNHTTLTLTFRLVNDKKIGAIRYTVLWVIPVQLL